MRIVGKTQEGKHVVAGLLWYYETIGLPLTVVFHCCDQRGLVPDWREFWLEARKAGWGTKTVISRLSEAIVDVWGPSTRDTIINGIQCLIGKGLLC